MGRVPYTPLEQADAKPYAETCTYDSGSMNGCHPLCADPATTRVLYEASCYGWLAADVCQRHTKPTLGRVYPYKTQVAPISGRRTR